jgi:asparagine synthase (glutamine-hydrolysing)
MCGLCGIINLGKEPVAESSLRNMMQTMKHRGPDDDGIFLENEIGLGFVRLSIIDLTEAGHQPMISDDGDLILVFNGEIFYYIEIREELKKIGYKFRTQTDSEVLLKAYIEWGDRCLHKFNGMWSFVIYNRKKNVFFIARDRHGIKPFYYYKDDNQFIFASEIPPILKVLNHRVQADYNSIFDYLVFNRTDQTNATFFKGIKKLQHGHVLRIDLNNSPSRGKLNDEKWYDLRSNLKEPFNTPEEYRELFCSAISLRLRSDVPVGVCLSGGIDSSSIVSVLNKDFHKTDLNTFSAVYEKGQPGDESEFINEFKQKLNSMLFITPSAITLYNDIAQFVRAHAEPVPTSSPYAQYKVMELARKNVVVTLDGQGADESLAGYHYFFGIYFKELFLKGNLVKLMHEIFRYLITHKSIYGLKSFLFYLLPDRLKTNFRIFKKDFLNKEFANKYKIDSSVARNLYASKSLQESLLDHFEYKLEHLLKWEDRNSMWFSIEARVPFLDYRLVERTIASPNNLLLGNGMTKNILRNAMKGTLPEKIRLRRDKVGFSTPQDNWFRTDIFTAFISEILSSKSFKARNIVDVKKAQTMYKKHLEGKINISNEIWKWMNLELWFREFIDVQSELKFENLK